VRATALLHSQFSHLDTLQEAIVRLECVFESLFWSFLSYNVCFEKVSLNNYVYVIITVC